VRSYRDKETGKVKQEITCFGKKMDNRIALAVKDHSSVKLLMTIPEINVYSAAVII
jgi:hypothetical protein